MNFRALRQRVSAIVFDKDNCLTAPYRPSIHPSVKDAFEECKLVFGLNRMAVLSNSAGSADDAPEFVRALELERQLGVPVIKHGSKVFW